MLPPQTPGSTWRPIEVPAFFQCPGCNEVLSVSDEIIVSHFLGQTVSCGSCGSRRTPWQVALKTMRENFRFTYFYILGAKSTLFRTKIFLNTETRFDLYAEGLPRDAMILDKHYCRGMFCTEMTPAIRGDSGTGEDDFSSMDTTPTTHRTRRCRNQQFIFALLGLRHLKATSRGVISFLPSTHMLMKISKML